MRCRAIDTLFDVADGLGVLAARTAWVTPLALQVGTAICGVAHFAVRSASLRLIGVKHEVLRIVDALPACCALVTILEVKAIRAGILALETRHQQLVRQPIHNINQLRVSIRLNHETSAWFVRHGVLNLK